MHHPYLQNQKLILYLTKQSTAQSPEKKEEKTKQNSFSVSSHKDQIKICFSVINVAGDESELSLNDDIYRRFYYGMYGI